MAYADITKKRAYDRAYWLRVKGKGPVSPAAALNRSMDVVQKLTDIKGPKHGLTIAYVPDVQAMPGSPIDHLRHLGMYIARRQPDVVYCAGDFGDFPSLSRFGRGERKWEGRRYKNDIGAFHRSMEALVTPIAKVRGYKPWMEFGEGNHESHLDRITQEFAFLDGWVNKEEDLKLTSYGWRVHPFMQPVSIGGVAFCHYFPSGIMGKPITTAHALLGKLHMSAIAGHQPGRDVAYGRRADGSQMTAIISGSFYQHDMEHLSPFTNAHWRGMYMLHEVRDGQFDEMAVSINFLKRKFG